MFLEDFQQVGNPRRMVNEYFEVALEKYDEPTSVMNRQMEIFAVTR
ncbi:hypothetical protein [Halobellus inordinatus]|nr:hypothetical protein [Halobellus ramosii]